MPWQNRLAKLFDVHSHPPGDTCDFLYFSGTSWGRGRASLGHQYKPDDVVEPMKLCNVTPDMRVRAVNLRACDIKYSAAIEIAHFVSKTSSLQVGSHKSTNTDAAAGAKVQILTHTSSSRTPTTGHGTLTSSVDSDSQACYHSPFGHLIARLLSY